MDPVFGFDAVISGYGNPTSLQFVKGPNGEDLLVTSQQDGTVSIWNVTSTGSGSTTDFSATLVFETQIVQTIFNHDDDGSLSSVTGRQVTGFLVQVDQNGDLDIYVSSSDPRIGGGNGGLKDTALDTNSGVLSRLDIDVPADPTGTAGWSVTKTDLLRGIPRSEENHSVNGMDFTPDGKLLLQVGGFTNAGAPSQNLVYTPDYFLSGAILEVDIAAIEALPLQTDEEGQSYKYDLPTLGVLRGPRSGNVLGEGFSKNLDSQGLQDNPWGGNDGYNQAYLEPGGPIEIFAEGFRNAYDIEVVPIDASHPSFDPTPGADNFLVYTWDNGANNNWGDPSVDAAGNPITLATAHLADNVPVDENNSPVSPGVQDQLHLVQRGGYYGHPVPSRVNPEAKLYLKPEVETAAGNVGANAIVAPEFATNSLWDYLPAGVTDPLNGFVPQAESGFYLKPQTGGGSLDGELVLNNGSTNGIVVFNYDPLIHPPELQQYDGDLFATGFDEQILRVEFSPDGSAALNRVDIESNNAWQASQGSNPLDVTVGPGGSIWVAAHGGNNIFAFVPGGTPIVDDSNDDDDALADNLDPFQLDPDNGLGANSNIAAGEFFEFTMENEIGPPNGIDGFALGFTGHMVNYNTEFFNQSSGVVQGGILDGGIAGKLQIEFDAVGDGTAQGLSNDLTYALQSGVNFDSGTQLFLMESVMTNPWSGSTPAAGQSMGIYFGTGTQFDFAQFNFGINSNGEAEVQIYIEINDVQAYSANILAPGLADNISANGGDMIMSVVVDRINMTVTPTWSYETLSGTQTGSLAPISLDFDNDPTTVNNLEEALFGAGEGGFLARGAPSNGQQGQFIFGNLTTQFTIPLGLAVGVNGRVDTAPQTGNNGETFAPEFDNLLITASDANGIFAPDTEDDFAGAAELNQTIFINPSDLLLNDRDLQGQNLTVTGVSNAVGGTVQLVNGLIEFTGSIIGLGSFEYTVANDSGVTSQGTAQVDVTAPPPLGTVIYRVNAGSGTIAAIDGGPDWIGDTTPQGQTYLTGDSGFTYSQGLTNSQAEMDLTNVDDTVVPWQLFVHERSDITNDATSLEYTFDVTQGETYAVTLYYVENWNNIFTNPNRIFDVSVNGVVPPEFDDIHPLQEAADYLGTPLPSGSLTNAQKQPYLGTAFQKTHILTAQSAQLVLNFLHNSQNPKINAIEITQVTSGNSDPDISIGDVTVTEGGDMVFDISATQQVSELVTVTYEVVPGTAQPGVDYNVLGGSLPDAQGIITGSVTFAVGSADQSIVVTTIDDALINGDRGFTINLTGISQGTATIGTGTAQGLIQDDDAPPPAAQVSIVSQGDVVESGDAGVSTVAFDVTFDTPPSAPVIVTYDVTVTIGGVPTTTTGLTTDLGTTGGVISVDVPNDNLDDGSDSVAVTLTGVSVASSIAVITTASASALVTEDDGPDVLSIQNAGSVQESGDAGDTVLGFAISTASSVNGDVDIQADISINGVVQSITQTVTLTNGSGVLNVNVPNDDLDNGTEAVSATLTGVTTPNFIISGSQFVGTGSVTEDDAPLDPNDIDGDGILNGDDPFAYDATNGTGQVLLAGGEILQDFNTDTSSPFDASAGFTGILVNPNFNYNGSATDPYGSRTVESNVSIANGQLTIVSSQFDAFATGLVNNRNSLADGYQSGVDVSGINSFEVVARASSADLATKAATTSGFEQFGISLGAGGVDDFVKLIVGDGGNGAPRVELGHDQALVGGKSNAYGLNSGNGPAVDLNLVGDIEFRLIVDKAAGTVTGQVDFYALSDGSLLTSFTTPAELIAPGSAFEAALNGLNPLTGGQGGIAYGVFVNDWGGGGTANQITANYDFLRITSLDGPPATSTLSILDAGSVQESGDAGDTIVDFTISADSSVSGDVDLQADISINGVVQSITQTVTLTNGSGVLSVNVPNDNVDDGTDTVSATLTGVTTANFTISGTQFVGNASVTEDDAPPPASQITIASQGDIVETGDVGVSTVAFDVSFDIPPVSPVTVTYDVTVTVGGVPTTTVGLTSDLGTTGGVISVDVPNDNSENGADNVSVTLTGVSVASTVAVITTAAASALVTEDDAPTILSIQDAGSVPESGDVGDTVIAFAIAANTAVTGNVDLQVDVSIDGVVQSITQTVALTNGAGVLSINVPNDNVDDGTDAVSATLTGVTTPDFVISSSQFVGTASITEDDGPDILSIQNAGSVQESGDAGDTVLGFAISTASSVNGDVDIQADISINGVVQSITQTVTLTNGSGVLNVNVPNDDLDNGTDAVSATLTGVTTPNFIISGTQFVGTGSVTEDDAPLDPNDIDGDGILNGDDPFAYDATNGTGQVLLAGGEILQDFNTDTSSPFDASAGFTGILVNPNFNYNGSATDPYGSRTVESNVSIANGQLSITSSQFDAFALGTTNSRNTIADAYQSGVDVSGINTFEVVARASSADFATKFATTSGREQFGISIGAGGVDDFVKLIISDGGNGTPGVELSHNQSLVGGQTNFYGINTNGPTVDLNLVGDIEFRMVVDKAAGTVIGQIDFYALSDGSLLTSFTTPTELIAPGSSLEAALNGSNPLTGGQGGLAYGVFLHDRGGGGTANQITADYDFLRITSLDGQPSTSTLSILDAGSVQESGDAGDTVVDFAINADTSVNGDVDLQADISINGVVQSITQTVTLTNGAGVLSVNVPNDNVDDGTDAVSATLTGVTTANFAISGTQFVGTASVTEDDGPPPASQVSITSQGSVVESGDVGVSTVAFDVGFDTPPSAPVTVTYDVTVTIDGVPTTTVGLTSDLGTTGGVISVDVPNDDLENGADNVSVTLTGVSVASTVAVINTATASALVIEDEAPAIPATDVVNILNTISTSATYINGEVGSATFLIKTNNVNQIDSSNFAPGSFEIQNTGDKKIAAFFIDVRGALYTDSVFDPDGQGGDTAFKPWQVDNAGGTGAFITGSGYFLPGPNPIAGPGNGGFEGVLGEFTDFDNGETATFSGDMDPNSIAALAKSDVDSGATASWDVGGVSGAELIGSAVYVLFDDGSIATGQLMGDGTLTRSQALITETPANKVATLDVTTAIAGEYGGTVPQVVVTGTPGDTVRVVLTKGFDPVTNPAVDALVAQRLTADPFGVNNAFDFQTVDVVIPATGTIDISDQFDYVGTQSGVSFLGDDVQSIAFVSAVIDPVTQYAEGPVSDPIRLVSDGTPVDPLALPSSASTSLASSSTVKLSDDGSAQAGFVSLMDSGSAQTTLATPEPLQTAVTDLDNVFTPDPSLPADSGPWIWVPDFDQV